MNDNTIDLLNDISKNTEMGKNTVRRLLQITKDEKMKMHLQRQLRTYENLSRRSHAMLGAFGAIPKEQSPMAKLSADMSIKMKTAVDNSPQNMANMLIKGSEMGINDMQNSLSKANSQNTNEGAIALAQRLKDAQTDYKDELSDFI